MSVGGNAQTGACENTHNMHICPFRGHSGTTHAKSDKWLEAGISLLRERHKEESERRRGVARDRWTENNMSVRTKIEKYRDGAKSEKESGGTTEERQETERQLAL